MTEATDSSSSLDATRDRVVALAGDVHGSRVLDVGCGDGLIGRALLSRVGADGSVVFADQDADALDRLAEQLDGTPNVEYLKADARQLDGIPDDSVQRVILRAVLLYVPEKQQALHAAWRVLQPGGRIVISEPVNRVLYESADFLWGYDLRDIPLIASKVRRGFLEHEHPHVRAMTDWDDQDLFTMVGSAGFRDVFVETVTESVPPRPLPWLAFMHARWTPWMPTVAQVVQSVLDASERSAFETTLRPLVEQGRQSSRVCNTFIVGTK
jgi:arsenite methyltransferase